jgi:NDP-sugar pyrophosphorylase family protein
VRERLTITLDQELLRKVDAIVDGVNVRNRSHAIEQLLAASIEHSKPSKAVVFAGGTPVALGGKFIPIPMTVVRGRPIIDYIMDELKRNGISHVIIVMGVHSQSLMGHLGDGSQLGIRVSYAIEERAMGTEGALGLVRERVRGESFFALNGDNIFTVDLDSIYRQHLASKAVATIALTPAESSARFGVTMLEGNRITSFVQKHERGSGATLVNAGIYLFSPEVFDFIGSPKGRTMLEEHLFPALAGSGKLYGYVFSGPWYSLDSSPQKS